MLSAGSPNVVPIGGEGAAAAPSMAALLDPAGKHEAAVAAAQPAQPAQHAQDAQAAQAAAHEAKPAVAQAVSGHFGGNVFGKLEFTPDFSALGGSRARATLSWVDVRMTINGREILKGVSGKVRNSEVCALLGPSGAGKSSLLNILAGRISSRKGKVISGKMLVNDQEVSPVEFRKNVAYVLQEDALYATSTAREALEFSAALRLPRTVLPAERVKLIDELLVALGLKHVENTFCGSAMVRGLSGGEKKRVSIGVELVTNPQILFLDEPTSGLDSYSAFQVCSILRALSRSGCAVLCTIHQPSSEIFAVFDKAMVLAKGGVVYNGPVRSIPEVLSAKGFPMPALTNPADYVMVLAQTRTEEELPRYNQDMDEDARMRSSAGRDESRLDGDTPFTKERASSGWTQLHHLSVREWKNLGRDKGALIGRFGITLFLNVLFGWIFFDAANPNNAKYTTYSHFGALTNIFISALFGASQPPLLTFPLERVVFLREYSTHTYSSSPYFFSKLMVEIPLYFVGACLIIAIVYNMESMQGSWIILILEIFLLQVVSASYAFLIGAAVNNVKQAQELAPLIFVPQLLFTGFFVSISQIPPSIQWVQYLCSLKYGLNLGMITELGGNRCQGSNPSFLTPAQQAGQFINGTQRVEACQQILFQNNVVEADWWIYVLVLLCIFIAFRLGSLIILISRANNFTS